MFHRILFLFIIFTSSMSYAQIKAVPINSETLYEKIKSNKKPAVIHFWIPVCDNPIKILKRYQELADRYKNVDFYFIGITNKEELLEDLIKEAEVSITPYMIDKNISPDDIYNRFPAFTNNFTKIIKGTEKHFIAAYISKNLSKKIFTQEIYLNPKKIQRISK